MLIQFNDNSGAVTQDPLREQGYSVFPRDRGKGGAVMTIKVRKVEPVKSTKYPDS